MRARMRRSSTVFSVNNCRLAPRTKLHILPRNVHTLAGTTARLSRRKKQEQCNKQTLRRYFNTETQNLPAWNGNRRLATAQTINTQLTTPSECIAELTTKFVNMENSNASLCAQIMEMRTQIEMMANHVSTLTITIAGLRAQQCETVRTFHKISEHSIVTSNQSAITHKATTKIAKTSTKTAAEELKKKRTNLSDEELERKYDDPDPVRS